MSFKSFKNRISYPNDQIICILGSNECQSIVSWENIGIIYIDKCMNAFTFSHVS